MGLSTEYLSSRKSYSRCTFLHNSKAKEVIYRLALVFLLATSSSAFLYTGTLTTSGEYPFCLSSFNQGSPNENEKSILDQQVIDDYIETQNRHYRRLHDDDSVSNHYTTQTGFTSAWSWLMHLSPLNIDQQRKGKEDDALYVLDLAKLASVELLQRHHFPIKSKDQEIGLTIPMLTNNTSISPSPLSILSLSVVTLYKYFFKPSFIFNSQTEACVSNFLQKGSLMASAASKCLTSSLKSICGYTLNRQLTSDCAIQITTFWKTVFQPAKKKSSSTFLSVVWDFLAILWNMIFESSFWGTFFRPWKSSSYWKHSSYQVRCKRKQYFEFWFRFAGIFVIHDILNWLWLGYSIYLERYAILSLMIKK